MGQLRFPSLMMGTKHHHPHNAAHMKKLLIWSLGLVIPFLVLLCIFPSSASLYSSSYNRVLVSQVQIPSSRAQSRSFEPRLSSGNAPLYDKTKLPSQASDADDDDSSVGGIAANLPAKDGKKQSDLATAAENSGAGKADILRKATRTEHIAKKTTAPSVSEVIHSSSSKAKQQNQDTMTELWSADEGSQSSPKAKKQSEAVEAKKHNDGHKVNPLPKKAKKQNDEDDEWTMSEMKEQNEEPEVPSIDVKLDPSSKKAKSEKTQRDDDEFEINAFTMEEVVDEQYEEPHELNAESGNKKSTKKGKTVRYNTEEMMPELIELDDELSISGKKEVEDSIATKRKADQHDEGSSTAKSSKKAKAYGNELEEEDFSILGKESSLDEDPTSSKQASRKAMGMSSSGKDDVSDSATVSSSGKKTRSKRKEEIEDMQEDEKDELTHTGEKAKSFAKLGKSSDDGEGSFADDQSSDLGFLKRADEEAFLAGHKKKKKKVPIDGSDPDENSSGGCRYFDGKWTMDSNSPPYMDSSCPWKSINDDQSCNITGNPKYWRWQPTECKVKRFRAVTFLKLMRGKSMAFVGDKMVKAQLKSLVCLLAKVETPSLLYNDKSNQSMSWRFNSSNVTLSLVWSPFLVQQTSEQKYSKLWLDKLDTKWAEMVPTLDVLILGVGASFVHPSLFTVRNSVVGCYSCQGLSSHIDITNLKEISLYSGFRAAMRSSIMGIGALPGFTGISLFLQPCGFEGNGSYYGVSLKMKDIQDQEIEKARIRGSIANQSKMEVLHTNLKSVSNYDPIKYLYSPSCLIPSPLVDTWNQVLQHTLIHMFTLASDA